MITQNKLDNVIKCLKDRYNNVSVQYTAGVYHNQFKVSIYTKPTNSNCNLCYLSFELKETKECGVLKFESFTYTTLSLINDKDFMEKYFHIFKLFMQELNKNCIAYYAFLGDAYKSHHEKLLLNLGFEVLTEYRNAQHGPGYKQRLYFLNTEQKWK